ncbi:MAG: DUF2207 domain-containing protein [Candidatus Bipolaricaulia bacterium]
MQRLRLVLPVLVAVFVLLGVGVTATSVARADVEDFRYAAWRVTAVIDRDGSGRAFAEITEELTAQFPEFDQNRGIVRALPLTYQFADAAPEDIRVTDGTGAAVPFEVTDDDTFRIIAIGDDRYVRGEQRYTISYRVADVVIAADGRDEFYWDLVPIERPQRIEVFSAELIFSPALAPRLTGAIACFTGPAYATSRCEIEAPVPQADGSALVRIPELSLAPGSGVTGAVALTSGSVTQPPARLPNPFLDVVPIVLTGLALVAAIGAAVVVRRTRAARRRARGVIVAQYDVPDDLPPLVAAPIIGKTRSPVAAEFVHLAVRGAIRFEEEGTAPRRGTAPPLLRLVNREQAPDALDRRTLTELFASDHAGALRTLPQRDAAFGRRMKALADEGASAALERGFLVKQRIPAAAWLRVGAAIAAAAGLAIVFFAGERDNLLTASLSYPLGIAAGMLSLFVTSSPRLHTSKGAETREYFEGVREFIRVAEADRLRLLQGQSTAERRSDGSVDVVHLYERLLPYAMLFGLEREWGQVLEVTYQERDVMAPTWYPALGAHGLGQLDRRMSGIAQSFSSSVSYTASGSGGTAGGGFSGGGGGGGFSGGR